MRLPAALLRLAVMRLRRVKVLLVLLLIEVHLREIELLPRHLLARERVYRKSMRRRKGRPDVRIVEFFGVKGESGFGRQRAGRRRSGWEFSLFPDFELVKLFGAHVYGDRRKCNSIYTSNEDAI